MLPQTFPGKDCTENAPKGLLASANVRADPASVRVLILGKKRDTRAYNFGTNHEEISVHPLLLLSGYPKRLGQIAALVVKR